MVPPSVLAECRVRALETILTGKCPSRAAGGVIIVIWLLVAALGIIRICAVFKTPS